MDPVTLLLSKKYTRSLVGISVADFGAKGDGETDDSAAFAAAIDAAVPGQAIIVPPGSYYVADSVWINKSGVSLIGFGYASEIFTDQEIHVIRVQGTNTNNRISNILIQGLRIRGMDDTSDAKPSGIWTGPTGIEIMFANHVTVDGCWIEDHPYDGIGIPQAAAHITVSNNYVTNSYDDGINPGGNPTQGVVEHVHIIGNRVENVRGVGIHHSNGSRRGVTANNTVILSTDMSANCLIDVISCSDWVVQGNVLIVEDVVTENVPAIRANNASRIKIDANIIHSQRTAISMVSQANLQNTQFTISNNDIYVSEWTSGSEKYAINIGQRSSDVLVIGNRLSGGSIAVNIGASDPSTVSDVTVHGNRFENNAKSAIVSRTPRCRITNNTVVSAGRTAIVMLTGSDESHIVENTIDGTGDDGIVLESNGSYVHGNFIRATGEAIVDDGSDNILTANETFGAM